MTIARSSRLLAILRVSIASLLLFLGSATSGEIFRQAVTCPAQGNVCFYWWPKLPEIAGWKQDMGSSYQYSINALSPDDSTFAKSETVIYGKAAYKARLPTFSSIDEFIKFDHANFKASQPNLEIVGKGNAATASNIALKLFQFSPTTSEGNWEIVAYGEEKDSDGNEYYLTFTVSSRSQNGLKDALPTYRNMLAKYQ